MPTFLIVLPMIIQYVEHIVCMFRTAAFMIFRRRHITPLLFLAALMVTTLFSQTISVPPYDVVDHLFFSRIGTAELASGGVRTAEAGSLSAPFNNPALLRAPSLTLYAEFGKRSEAAYIADITADGQYLLPSFGQISVSTGDFHWALAYASQYDRAYDYGEVEVTTVQQPEGTEEVWKAMQRIRVHAAIASASFVLDDGLSIGLSTGMNIVSSYDEIFTVSATGHGTGLFMIAGLYGKPFATVHLGSSLRLSENVLFSPVSDNMPRSITDTSNDGNNAVIRAFETSDWQYSARFPVTAQAGCVWEVTEVMSLMAEIEMEGWSELSVTYESTVDVHVGVLLKPHPLLHLRGGYFTETAPQKSPTTMKIDQKFMTAGFEWTALPGVVITGSAVRSVWSGIRSYYLFPPKEGFYQHLYQLGLLYRLQ